MQNLIKRNTGPLGRNVNGLRHARDRVLEQFLAIHDHVRKPGRVRGRLVR